MSINARPYWCQNILSCFEQIKASESTWMNKNANELSCIIAGSWCNAKPVGSLSNYILGIIRKSQCQVELVLCLITSLLLFFYKMAAPFSNCPVVDQRAVNFVASDIKKSKLKLAICNDRRGLLCGWFLSLHDNARSYSTAAIAQVFRQLKFEFLPPPPPSQAFRT